MNNKNINQELSIENFLSIIKKMETAGIKNIKLLGGEPTLHSRFEEIMNLAISHFDTIQLFTNGLFSKEIYSFLKKNGRKIQLTVNISTPAFQNNADARKILIERITKLSGLTSVSLSIVIDPTLFAKSIIDLLDKNILQKIKTIRFGLLNPVAGQKNQYSQTDFPKIGNNTITAIHLLKKLQPNLAFVLDCGFAHCMFTTKQHKLLDENNVKAYYFGCFLNRQLKHYDIQTDLNVISCYSMSNKPVTHFGKESLKVVESKLFVDQYINQSKYLLDMCSKCRFHGRGYYKCFGPCLGFRINQKK